MEIDHDLNVVADGGAQVLHEPADRHIRDLQGEVNGVDLPAKRMHACATAREHRSQEPLENCIVGGVGENRLTGVTALDDVINAARFVKSGST